MDHGDALVEPAAAVGPSELHRLADRLRAAGFRGDVADDPGARYAAATDNSIYQIVPDLVVAPEDADDVALLLRVLAEPAHRHLAITARGGSTGTNGQALNRGVIVDFRPRMRRLLALDADAGWVDVEPGLVLDELNRLLAPHGVFFSPTTSTADRCTIGGMIATDASGKGSRVYGKTGDNVLALDVLLADGTPLTLAPGPDEALDALVAHGAPGAATLTAARGACDEGRAALVARVPDLARHFVGYDLVRARPGPDSFDPTRLIIGAEGTLALVTRARLKLTKLPRHRRLVVVGYRSFDAALASASTVLAVDPVAIETLDDTVHELAAARGLLDDLPARLREPLPPDGRVPVCNYVEFAGDDADVLDRRVDELEAALGGAEEVVGWHTVSDDDEAQRLWGIRRASVGLLGASEGRRRPIAFVEDCVVPPERMRDFVADFRRLLDREGLSCGAFGHVDVGCIHVRPALDPSDPEDRVTIRRVSDAVFDLVRKHGGIFWGEHGKGVRGEYLRAFVGDEAYAAFVRVKRAFDPDGRLNPGKLVDASASGEGLLRIDRTPFRAAADIAALEEDPGWRHALRCNGNAQCLTYAATVSMCPSYKATLDRRHSPKGRADLVRTWLRLRTAGPDQADGFAGHVQEALAGCLGCKACASSCPIHVDVPELKSRFLEDYHRRRRRPAGDRLLAALERAAPLAARFAGVANMLLASPPARLTAERLFGLVDLPAFSEPSVRSALARRGVRPLAPADLLRLTDDERSRAVVLVPDAFTLHFDAPAFLGLYDLLERLGYRPLVARFRPAGKALHVKGFRGAFRATARAFVRELEALAAVERPLVGIEPSVVLMLRQEYRYLPDHGEAPPVLLPQEFLAAEIGRGAGEEWPRPATPGPLRVFRHCTETTALADDGRGWREVLARLGIDAEMVAAGCCGMAGSFGHEAANQTVSKRLFAMSWQESLEGGAPAAASGFSCRAQAHRLTGRALPHPLAVAAARLS